MDNILTALANKQAELPKEMISDPEQFNRDRTKFEDWQRGIRLFLKSNKVTATDNRITMIITHHRGGVAGIYVQKKLNELDEETDTQDWNKFV